MTNVVKTLLKLKAGKQERDVIEVAREMYAPAPFHKDFLGLHRACKRWAWVPSVLSAAGMGMGLHGFLGGDWLALLAGLSVAAILESGKVSLIGHAARAWLKGLALGALLAGLALLLTAGSVAGAWFGGLATFEAVRQARVAEAQAGAGAVTAQELAEAAQGVTDAQNALTSFEKQNQVFWKGRWVLSEKAKAGHAKLAGALADASQRLADAQERGRVRVEQAGAGAGDKVAGWQWALVGVSVLVELCILFALIFPQYYLFRANMDSELLEEGQAFEVTLSQLASLVPLLRNTPAPALTFHHQPAPAPGRIGFQPTTSAPASPTSAAQSPQNSTPPAPPAKSGLAPRPCEHCKQEYVPRVSWQRYCRKSCNHAANGFQFKTT
jgi:hypothetical protein